MVFSSGPSTRTGFRSGTATSNSTIDLAEQFAAEALRKRASGDPSSGSEAAAAAVLSPGEARYWSILGNLHVEARLGAPAIRSLERAFCIQPDLASTAFNLANAWYAADDPAKATDLYLRSVCLDPSYSASYANLGSALRQLGEIPRAIRAYSHATRARPDHAEPHWNLATALLLAGDFQQGLPAFEWRKRLPEHRHRSSRVNPWRPDSDIVGKTVLVHEEQGLGDLIQFSRFLPEVTKRGARCALVCSARIAPLIRESKLADIVLTDIGTALTNSGPDILHADIMSLPWLLGISPANLPFREKYLKPCDDRRKRWHWIRKTNAINIGIAWQGRISPIDRGRSFPLTCFRTIAEDSRVNLISLQRNEGREQLASSDMPNIQDLTDDLDSDGAFLDTVAVMSELDLVITSDTAIAHAAGAVGVPVWIALQYVPDWRWGMASRATPWYPSARLYRQTERGNWTEVFRRITNDLLQPQQ